MNTIRITALAAIVCVAAVLGCGDGNPVRRLAGTYVLAGDARQYLKVHPDGAFSFRSLGGHPGFLNTLTDAWVPANARIDCMGPSGRATVHQENGRLLLAMSVTRTTRPDFMQTVFQDLGCPDVGDLLYSGYTAPVGSEIHAVVEAGPQGRIVLRLAAPEDPAEGGPAALEFVRDGP